MKIRSGFVSNSSSSSFLIKYPLKPFSLKDTENILDEYEEGIPDRLRGVFDYFVWKNQPSFSEEIDYECAACTMLKDHPASLDFFKKPLPSRCPLKRYSNLYTNIYLEYLEECEDSGCEYLKKLSNEEHLKRIFERQYEWASEEQINNPKEGFYKDLKELKENIDPQKETLKILYVNSDGQDNDEFITLDDSYEIHKYTEKLFKTHKNIIESEA